MLEAAGAAQRPVLLSMGSGREGSSTTIAATSPPIAALPASSAAVKQGMSSSMLHKLQREELLQGGSSNIMRSTSVESAAVSGTRSPRMGRTPSHSPRSMSPLHSPRPGVPSTEEATIDFQEAIMRIQKSPTMPARVGEMQEDDDRPSVAVVVQRSRSDIAVLQHQKGPVPSSRSKAGAETMPYMEHEPMAWITREMTETHMEHEPVVGITRGMADIQEDRNPSERVVLERGKSPRRTKPAAPPIIASEVQESVGAMPSSERKSTRSSSRRATRAGTSQDAQDMDLGMGDANRVTRRSHSRPHTRQHKRKTCEPISVTMPMASSTPEPYFTERHHHQEAGPYVSVSRTANVAASASPPSLRRNHREAILVDNTDWLQFLVDIFMWRHIPRSALLFGVGCFCIMSTSLVQDMQYSAISILAHIALFYLAAIFIKHTFLRSASPVPSASIHMLSESDALRLVRLLLPPVNILLHKLGQLFSGEPIVTLKVAAGLWLLAQAGSMMSLWTLTRIAYFALFTIPKCYSSYNEMIRGQVRNCLQRIQVAWEACTHKKAVLVGAFALAWNFSSVSTRLCGAFICLVALRAYKHVFRSEPGNDNPADDIAAGLNFAPPYGLELMAVAQPKQETRP